MSSDYLHELNFFFFLILSLLDAEVQCITSIWPHSFPISFLYTFFLNIVFLVDVAEHGIWVCWEFHIPPLMYYAKKTRVRVGRRYILKIRVVGGVSLRSAHSLIHSISYRYRNKRQKSPPSLSLRESFEFFPGEVSEMNYWRTKLSCPDFILANFYYLPTLFQSWFTSDFTSHRKKISSSVKSSRNFILSFLRTAYNGLSSSRKKLALFIYTVSMVLHLTVPKVLFYFSFPFVSVAPSHAVNSLLSHSIPCC